MVNSSFCDYRKFNFGYTSCLAVDCMDKSEKLTLLWNKEVNYEILSNLSSVIHG